MMDSMVQAAQLGTDVTFELDKFHRPRLRGEAEIVKNVLLYILFSKPGQYPSLPHIGLNISNRLYSFWDEISEIGLRDEIVAQCRALQVYFEAGEIAIRKVKYRGKPSLLINVTTSPYDSHVRGALETKQEINQTNFLIGVTFNEMNEMIYNIGSGEAA